MVWSKGRSASDERWPRLRPSTEGLSRLDQARAASLADEGGASAARLETQEPSGARLERRVVRRLTILGSMLVGAWTIRRIVGRSQPERPAETPTGPSPLPPGHRRDGAMPRS
jgi:hypothetical protein